MLIGFEKQPPPPGVITLVKSCLETYGTGTGRPKLQVTVDVGQFSGQSSVVNMKYRTEHFLYTPDFQCHRYAL